MNEKGRAPPDALEKEKAEQIQKYESFVNDRLRVDLEIVLKQRDQIYQEIADYLELRNNLGMLETSAMKEIKTLIDLGSNFYATAKVPDTSRILMNIGFGFHLELTIAEAMGFIKEKEELLQKKADVLTQKAAEIKARIKLIIQGIGELMELPQLENPLREDLM